MNFKIQPQLFNQAFLSTWAKGRDKNLDILRTKRAFNMKENPFFIIFEELSLKEIIILFGKLRVRM